MRRAKQIAALFFLLFLVGFTVFGIMFVGAMKHASELLGSLPDKLRKYSTQPSQIMSANGQVLYTVQFEYRKPVKYEDIPPHVRDAILAAEDKRFFSHSGVDYLSMGRILFVGAREGRLSQGGSTLTMQLAKRFYSEGEKTFNRKLQDVALAITMERDMSKEQILTLYLNTMYFGEKAYGIQAAADVYFGKPIDKLTLAEAAMLARCVRRPSDENPIKNLDKSIENRNTVLKIMLDERMISQSEYEQAIGEKVHLSPPKERITSHLNKAPYFVDHVLQTLQQDEPEIDLKTGGYTIYTTLQTDLEDYAEKQVLAFVKEHSNSSDHVNDAAFVLIDKDGKILAEVGGVNYGKSQFNIVTQGSLQPGSSFKPFLYSTAFSQGVLTMGDRLPNYTFVYPGTESWPKPWVVHNSSPKEDSNSADVPHALASSLNVPAAHVMEKVGPVAVADLARGAFGFRIPQSQVTPSMALGTAQVSPLEMAEGYSVFMLHGDRVKPYCITKIVGPDGGIIRSYEPQLITNQLDPRVTDEIDQLLQYVVQWGTGHLVGEVLPTARGKTGTTSSHKDCWFCGYNDGLVGVGWIGRMTIKKGKVTQEQLGHGMWGASTAIGFWAPIMKKASARFGSQIPGLPKPATTEPNSDSNPDNPKPDDVKLAPPDDQGNPPDGTTGGDGKPVITPPNGKPPGPGGTGGTAGAGTGGSTAGTATGGPPPDTTPPDDNPPARPPKRDNPRRRGDTDEQTDTVQVEVCAESGMRATIYCPETVTRTYRRGHEPKRRCTLHGG